MKLNNMKRAAAAVASMALLLGLAGCGAGSSSSAAQSGASSTASSTVNTESTGACKTGLGIVVGASVKDDRNASAVSTAVAVVLDSEGRIVSAALDVAQNSGSANEDGTLAVAESYQTKQELGDDYGMRKASGIGKEWYEQADAFCAYIVGMTADEVAAIPTDGSDADLAAGCTVGVDTFIEAAVKACQNAQELGANAGDTLSLAIVSENAHGNKDATAEEDGKLEIDSTFVVVTKDADGKVTSAVCDMVQAAFTVAADGTLTAPEAVLTKLEKGDDYGMRKASSIGKEWYEQSEGFCAYLVGKDAGEIAAIPTDGSDADLAASCTVGIDSMLNAAIKAAQ